MQIIETTYDTRQNRKNQCIQLLRGITIAAVVLIHCLGKEGNAPLIIKPWLYFSVMFFVFLSGYLTTKSKVLNYLHFYKKRIAKIIVPFVVWTVIYLLIDNCFTVRYFCKSIITGGASGHLYYLIDYCQLVLLTPVIYKLIDTKWKNLLYLITPCAIIANYLTNIYDISLAIPLPPNCAWLITAYLIGLEHERWERVIEKLFISKFQSVVMVLFAILFEIFESYLWRFFGIEAMSNTQVKFSSLVYFITLLIFINCIYKKNTMEFFIGRLFVSLGNLSFGIYCCHYVFINILKEYIPRAWPSGILLWIVSLILSSFLVFVVGKLLPPKVCGWIGFV